MVANRTFVEGQSERSGHRRWTIIGDTKEINLMGRIRHMLPGGVR